MSRWFTDPQTDKEHSCEICGCAMFGRNVICQKCERMLETYFDDEDE